MWLGEIEGVLHISLGHPDLGPTFRAQGHSGVGRYGIVSRLFLIWSCDGDSYSKVCQRGLLAPVCLVRVEAAGIDH